jgi:hypothetical protein
MRESAVVSPREQRRKSVAGVDLADCVAQVGGEPGNVLESKSDCHVVDRLER